MTPEPPYNYPPSSPASAAQNNNLESTQLTTAIAM